MKFKLVNVCDVKDPPGMQLIASLGRIEEFIDTIRKVGLFMPIAVRSDMTLVNGFHRLEAVKRLGWKTIWVQVIETDEEEDAFRARQFERVCSDLPDVMRSADMKRQTVPASPKGSGKRCCKSTDSGKKRGHKGKPKYQTGGLKPSARCTQIAQMTRRPVTDYSERIDAEAEETLSQTDAATDTLETMRLSYFHPLIQRKVARHIRDGRSASVNEALTRLGLLEHDTRFEVVPDVAETDVSDDATEAEGSEVSPSGGDSAKA